MRGTEFQRSFTHFNNVFREMLTFQFPVRNQGGFFGLTSLAAGEQTTLQFPVENISTLALGNNEMGVSVPGSQGQVLPYRGVGVHIEMPTGFAINPQDVEFKFVGVKVVEDKRKQMDAELRNTQNDVHFTISLDQVNEYTSSGIVKTFNGYFFPLPLLPAKEISNLKMEVRLKQTVSPYTYGQLRANLLLEDLYAKEWKLVQRRMHELRCEPEFLPSAYTQAILITTSSTTQQQFQIWMNVLTTTFGLATSIFSVSRYGKFGPRVDIWRQNEQGAVDDLENTASTV